MSGDIESLLRQGLADVAASAPQNYDDAGLAALAISGAGRIKRRRRIGAAASGASLLVLGAAVVVWQPWMGLNGDNGLTAADTSTAEAQAELSMEFLVETDLGFEVLNEYGELVPLTDTEPVQVFRLSDSYLYETAHDIGLTSVDGTMGSTIGKQSEDTRTTVNSAGTEYTLATPMDDYTTETYVFSEGVVEVEEALTEFTTSYELTLEDWTDTTTVFTGDLRSTTGQDGVGTYHFNYEMGWGLESVSEAGFETAVIADFADPEFVCVSDLNPGDFTAPDDETCGNLDSALIQDALADAAADADLVSSAVANLRFMYADPTEYMDLGGYDDRFYNVEGYWSDPFGRWLITGNPGEETWLLIDNVTGDEPFLAELAVPDGAVMPVYSAS
ncbi:hypothetical protein AB0B28_21385 [Glycomyces sp. NPDC046736]|uniref:hypothetical protein n=1 Tax=Glycomyces sp. NPDC046736 TaxID=3155615 RepID=UPI0033FEF509